MISEGFKIRTVWEWEHWRKVADPLGHIRWTKLKKWQDKNVVTDEGIAFLLNLVFYDTDRESGGQWRIGIFEDDYTPLSTDTYDSPGYTECITIQETDRPYCQFSQAAGGIISNAANQASFTFTFDKYIYGSALIFGTLGNVLGDSTAGATYIFAASKFSNGAENFIANDVAKVTISLNLVSG